MTGVTDEPVHYEAEDGVALITLDRPDRLNAWTNSLGRAYFDALSRADADPEVTVIVVTGAGKGYCAGADMDLLTDIGSGDRNGAGGGSSDPVPPLWHQIRVPKPIVAAINGACAGMGLAQALFCDIRFAASGAKFTTAFSRRGLIAEHGLGWVLPRLAGPAHAMDLLLSGRVFLAEEARDLGLVNRVVPGEMLLNEAISYARELVQKSSPTSMAVMKRQVWADLERPLAEAVSEADRLMVASFDRPDFGEGVQSYLQKRDPDFPPVDRSA